MKKYIGIGLVVASLAGGIHSIADIISETRDLLNAAYHAPLSSQEISTIFLLILSAAVFVLGLILLTPKNASKEKRVGIGLTFVSLVGGAYALFNIIIDKGGLLSYTYNPPYTVHESVVIALLICSVLALLVGAAFWAIGASEEPERAKSTSGEQGN